MRAMTLLALVIALRSVAWFGLLTFVPLWVVANGGSEGEGNRELSLMLIAGAAGTLILGPVADRIGLRRTLVVTQGALPALIVCYVAVGGVVGTLALMLVGLCVVGTFGITMVLSQLYLPQHLGMASGLSVGLAMGLGGIAAVALGAVADAVDLETALYVGAAAPAVGCVVCFLLPRPCSLGTPSRGRPRVHRLARLTRQSTRRDQMTAQEFFAALPEKADPEKTAGMQNTYVFDVENVGQWTVAVDDGTVTVTEGTGEADCTITASEETLVKIATGEANPTTAYMTGKLKIQGDMGAALKLQKLF